MMLSVSGLTEKIYLAGDLSDSIINNALRVKVKANKRKVDFNRSIYIDFKQGNQNLDASAAYLHQHCLCLMLSFIKGFCDGDVNLSKAIRAFFSRYDISEDDYAFESAYKYANKKSSRTVKAVINTDFPERKKYDSLVTEIIASKERSLPHSYQRSLIVKIMRDKGGMPFSEIAHKLKRSKSTIHEIYQSISFQYEKYSYIKKDFNKILISLSD